MDGRELAHMLLGNRDPPLVILRIGIEEMWTVPVSLDLLADIERRVGPLRVLVPPQGLGDRTVGVAEPPVHDIFLRQRPWFDAARPNIGAAPPPLVLFRPPRAVSPQP